jgi:large subunit ribosomal protein L24
MQKDTKIKTKLKVDNIVMVISGKDKGKKGKILKLDIYRGKVVVEGVNKVKKSVKKTQENQSGGFSTQEHPIHISNVMYYDNNQKRRVRLGYKFNDKNKKEIFFRGKKK